MTTVAVRRLAAAGCLVLVGTLGACAGDDGGGSGSDATADASVDDFCSSFNKLFTDVLSEDVAGGEAGAVIGAYREWAADLAKTGAPADMPDDARHGLELFLEQAEQIDEDATLDDLATLGDDLTGADRKDGEAFSTWVQDNCPLDLPSPPSPAE
jgi:hypothetical protein